MYIASIYTFAPYLFLRLYVSIPSLLTYLPSPS